ncbi:alpha/beta hydrolase [Micromonospora echinospora]|uniref:alpha/beta hydrolase family protein n=1 Tax=Micromonospora echinospora TaxID=1877 RepID=UPI0034091EAA
MELTIDADGVALPASLAVPDGHCRGGLVVLHGAAAGQRSFFLYDHLARVLPALGVAVLRYDRRSKEQGDVPLAVQAADARAALLRLRREVGDVPTGLWGVSQGAWAALVTAATHPADVAFLVLVSACGISPARQMRFGTAEQLRRAGFGSADVAELLDVRLTVEGFLRGDVNRSVAQAAVDRVAERAWFPLSYLRRTMPDQPGSWVDMDVDPAVFMAGMRCPTLLFYGETDDWMPVDESIAAWRQADTPDGTPSPEICRLPGCGHLPGPDGNTTIEGISPLYTETMSRWLDSQLPHRHGQRRPGAG